MMKYRSILVIALLLLAASAAAQEYRGVSLELGVSNGAGLDQVLVLGVRDGATTGLDPTMEEAELPPPPPNEIFDARCVGTPGKSQLGLGSLTDYRPYPTSGGPFTETYTVAYQAGINASTVVITWGDNLPGRVTKIVVDGVDQSGNSSIETQFSQGQATFDVTFDPSPLSFEANPNPVVFSVNNRDPLPEQTLTITPRGDPKAPWVLQIDVDWISVQPSSGEGETEVNVAVNTARMPAGTYEGIIGVRSEALPVRLDIPVRMEMTVGVGDAPVAGSMRLEQNYPNPFNPATMIELDLGPLIRGTVPTLKVSDLLGREVRDLSAALAHRSGAQSVQFDAADLPGGVYTCTLRYGTRLLTRRMLLVK